MYRIYYFRVSSLPFPILMGHLGDKAVLSNWIEIKLLFNDVDVEDNGDSYLLVSVR